MSIRVKIFLVVAILYTQYTLFPLLADTIRIPIWFPSIMSSSLFLCLYPKAFINKTFYWFLVYAMVLSVYLLLGKPLTIGIGTIQDSKKILIEFAYILPTICLFLVFYYLKNIRLARLYTIWTAIILYASFLVSVPLMNEYNTLREALIEEGEGMFIPGLPNYSLMHSYTLYLPVVCYTIKYKKLKWKIIGVVALISLCYVIYSTSVTTSLLVMVGIISASIVYNEKKKITFWLIIIFIIIIIYYFYHTGVILAFFEWIKPYFENSPVEPKINDFIKSIAQGKVTGGSIIDRQDLHDISWNSFFKNPILGTGVVGGHSSILDRFGGMGILGGIPFLMIFISFYKTTKTLYLSNSARAFLSIGMIASFTYLYEKGLWGSESWLMLFVILPLALAVLEDNSISEDNSSFSEETSSSNRPNSYVA